MYTEFFHLSEQPFSLTPDPRYLFMSERHREGLAHLLYGVQQPGGFVQLTGEVGSGKTTLSRCLVKQLPPETDVALILNPRLSAVELLATVCDELRICYPSGTESIKVLVDALNTYLLEAHGRRRRTVLIIDEAQNLHTDVLEQIRLLTNLETAQEKLLQVILIGQPELLPLLKRKELRQLAQRITARYHLLALSRSETFAYIQHRLLVAGRRDPLFTGSALRAVYRLSGGVPRLINIICDRALLGAYAMDKRRITAEIVRRASNETQGISPWHRKGGRFWLTAAASLAALVLGGGAYLKYQYGRLDAKAAGSSTQSIAPERISKPATAERERSAEGGFAALVAKSEGELASGLSDLYARWGIKNAPPELGCTNVKKQGFECLQLVGGWPKLRRYNVPAILELILPGGTRKRATITGLSEKAAFFTIGSKEFEFPISEIDQVWDGAFLILWKPPFAAHTMRPGMNGEDVAWLRRTLDRIDPKNAGAGEPDLYDEKLQRRIMAFQQSQSLFQDGLIGRETLVRLTLASEGAQAPSLLRQAR